MPRSNEDVQIPESASTSVFSPDVEHLFFMSLNLEAPL
jgi:hypothetical protein